MRHIFVDFEMNPLDEKYKEERAICRMEIMEIGAVMLDEGLKEISSFQCYVKPEYNTGINTRYTDLTGITTSMVTSAEHFASAFCAFTDWCDSAEGEYRIYAWSDNDLRQVRQEMKMKKIVQTKKTAYMMENWEDFQKTFCHMIGLDRPLSLERALGATGRSFEGQMHDALWDARNTSELFILSKDTENFGELMKPIVEALKPSEPTTFALGDVFNFDLLVSPAVS
ncbi:MAG: exonuclease domain-containing protein [Lachnospiraceae bacterium]